jgi:hypothetical protein
MVGRKKTMGRFNMRYSLQRPRLTHVSVELFCAECLGEELSEFHESLTQVNEPLAESESAVSTLVRDYGLLVVPLDLKAKTKLICSLPSLGPVVSTGPPIELCYASAHVQMGQLGQHLRLRATSKPTVTVVISLSISETGQTSDYERHGDFAN